MKYLEIFKRYTSFMFPNQATSISILDAIAKSPGAVNDFVRLNNINQLSGQYNGILCLMVIHNQILNDFHGNDFETTFTDDHMNLCLYHFGLFDSHGHKMIPLKEVLEGFAKIRPNQFFEEEREHYSFITS